MLRGSIVVIVALGLAAVAWWFLREPPAGEVGRVDRSGASSSTTASNDILPVEPSLPDLQASRTIEESSANDGIRGSAGLVARGRVLGPEGTPMAGATVRFTTRALGQEGDFDDEGTWSLAEVRADANGAYVADLEPAVAGIRATQRRQMPVVGAATAPGFETTVREVRANLTDGPWGPLDFFLRRPPCLARGRVLDAEARAVQGCHVGLVLDGERDVKWSAVTDALGRFEFRVRQAGTFRVVAFGADCGRGESAPVPLSPERDAMLEDLFLSRGGVIEGRLRHRDGQPAAGLRLAAIWSGAYDKRRTDWSQQLPSTWSVGSVLSYGETRTDANGTFRFQGLRDGEYTLSPPMARRVGDWPETVTTGAPPLEGVVERRLLVVDLFDASGRPIPGSSTSFQASLLRPDPVTSDGSAPLETDQVWEGNRGRVDLGVSWRADLHRVGLAVWRPDLLPEETVLTWHPDLDQRSMALHLKRAEAEPGTVQVTVLDPEGLHPFPLSVSVRSGLGAFVLASGFTRGDASVFLDEVPAGDWVLQVDDVHESRQARQPLQVLPGGAHEVEVTMPPVTRVRFVFRVNGLADGRILVETPTVTMHVGGDEPRRLELATLEGGAIRVGRIQVGVAAVPWSGVQALRLPHGPITFDCRMTGHRDRSVTVDVKEGETTDVEFLLEPAD